MVFFGIFNRQNAWWWKSLHGTMLAWRNPNAWQNSTQPWLPIHSIQWRRDQCSWIRSISIQIKNNNKFSTLWMVVKFVQVFFRFILSLLRSFQSLCLTKPMGSHTISSPFALTHPTPFEWTARSCANHMHTSTITFSWCSTLWTWFWYDFYSNFRGIIPSGFSGSLEIINKFTKSIEFMNVIGLNNMVFTRGSIEYCEFFEVALFVSSVIQSPRW